MFFLQISNRSFRIQTRKKKKNDGMNEIKNRQPAKWKLIGFVISRVICIAVVLPSFLSEPTIPQNWVKALPLKYIHTPAAVVPQKRYFGHFHFNWFRFFSFYRFVCISHTISKWNPFGARFSRLSRFLLSRTFHIIIFFPLRCNWNGFLFGSLTEISCRIVSLNSWIRIHANGFF